MRKLLPTCAQELLERIQKQERGMLFQQTRDTSSRQVIESVEIGLRIALTDGECDVWPPQFLIPSGGFPAGRAFFQQILEIIHALVKKPPQ